MRLQKGLRCSQFIVSSRGNSIRKKRYRIIIERGTADQPGGLAHATSLWVSSLTDLQDKSKIFPGDSMFNSSADTFPLAVSHMTTSMWVLLIWVLPAGHRMFLLPANLLTSSLL